MQRNSDGFRGAADTDPLNPGGRLKLRGLGGSGSGTREETFTPENWFTGLIRARREPRSFLLARKPDKTFVELRRGLAE